MLIKSYYQGVFNEVFIYFYPFIRPKSIDYELFEPETYPGKNEMIEKCELVTWKDFLCISGIESYHKLDVGLRTRILGLKKQYADELTARLIQDVCEKNNRTD
ncbi:DUF2711 family protein [Paenibacillus yanchengensis]|uniref:DUF2711 family protein n=1 Tax=Paenibacillus yanchengensis TaxID=2035833 RepID=A0ABW4YHT3_9BACL